MCHKSDGATEQGNDGATERRGDGATEPVNNAAATPHETTGDETIGNETTVELEDDDIAPSSRRPVAPSLSLSVAETAQDQRLDLYLVANIGTASRSAIQRAITEGALTVNGKTMKPSHRLSAGELIEGVAPHAPPIAALPEAIPLDIVFEDDAVIVINKPAGMVTHPGAGVRSGTLANALVYHLQQQAHVLPTRGGTSRPGIVHRLDVGTSGLIVAAKSDLAHLRLAEQFEARTVGKRYLALVYGVVKEDSGAIDAPIGRDPRSRVKMAVTESGRHALSHFRVIERLDEFTLVEIIIKTGRTHQIRVHLAHLRHPIVADDTYGGGRLQQVKHPQQRAAINRLKRPFLHAAALQFAHPVTNETLSFTAPLPAELVALLAQIRSLQAGSSSRS